MATIPAPIDDVRRPLWTVPVGLVAGCTLGQLAAAFAVLPLAAVGGGDDVTPIALLLASVGFGAAMLATIALLVRGSSEPLSAASLGLRRCAPVPALTWAALAFALVAAFAFFLAQVVDLRDVARVPPELDGRSAVADRLDVGMAVEHAAFGVGAVASALARVVVPAIVAEIVLRGFAMPGLASRYGEPLALAVTAVLTLVPLGFALGGEVDAGALVPIGLLLGVTLGLLYALTGSLLPGIALSAAAMGAGLGVSMQWSGAAIALLSASCCVVATGIAAAACRAPATR